MQDANKDSQEAEIPCKQGKILLIALPEADKKRFSLQFLPNTGDPLEGPTSEPVEDAGKLLHDFGSTFIEKVTAPEERGFVHRSLSQALTATIPEPRKIEKVLELTFPSEFFDSEKTKGRFVPERLAQKIMNHYSFLTLTDTREIYRFDKESGTWKLDGESKINELGSRLLSHESQINRLRETVAYIQNHTNTDRTAFDSLPINVIPVANGILDIFSGQLRDYLPDDHVTAKLPVKYDPNAEGLRIKRFFTQIVAPEDVPVLSEIAGYCLLRDYPVQIAIMCVGPGANGKSTFLGLLRALLGKENVSSESLQSLESSRFASAELWRKLANVHADLPGSALKGTGTFKMTTGSDQITAERKFRDPFTFVPYAKQIYSCNQVPYVEDESDAFYRRWKILNFPNQFENDMADKDLLKKLTTPEELSGLLNLALAGLKRVSERGFSNPQSTEEIREVYIERSNSLAFWVKKCVAWDPESTIVKDRAYNIYTAFCKKTRIVAFSRDYFFKHIRTYISVTDTKITVDGERSLAYRGMRINPLDDVHSVRPVRGCSNLSRYVYSDENKIKKTSDTSDTPDSSGGGDNRGSS